LGMRTFIRKDLFLVFRVGLLAYLLGLEDGLKSLEGNTV
jgi:hypothetical protein